MKDPKFTDGIKWPLPYRKACDTDITVNWELAKKKLEEEKRKRAETLKDLPTKLTALRRL